MNKSSGAGASITTPMASSAVEHAAPQLLPRACGRDRFCFQPFCVARGGARSPRVAGCSSPLSLHVPLAANCGCPSSPRPISTGS